MPVCVGEVYIHLCVCVYTYLYVHVCDYEYHVLISLRSLGGIHISSKNFGETNWRCVRRRDSNLLEYMEYSHCVRSLDILVHFCAPLVLTPLKDL